MTPRQLEVCKKYFAKGTFIDPILGVKAWFGLLDDVARSSDADSSNGPALADWFDLLRPWPRYPKDQCLVRSFGISWAKVLFFIT